MMPIGVQLGSERPTSPRRRVPALALGLVVAVGLSLAGGALRAETCDTMWQLKEHVLSGTPCADIADPHPAPPRPGDGLGSPDGKLFAKYLAPCRDGGDLCDPAEETRCVDGTRPMIHVDKAVDANGDDIESERWIFWVRGGGSCYTAEGCWNAYNNGNLGQMSTETAPLWKNGGGILSSDPAAEFADYNRVQIHKCSFDWFAGDASYDEEPINGGADMIDLPLHGKRLWTTAFEMLAPGITFEDESCSPGDECNTLPPLSDASQIVLTGWSAGGRGLIHHVDEYAERFQVLAPDADVRAVFDGRFPAMMEVEAVVTGAATSIYDHNWDAGDLPDVAWDGTADNAYSIDKFCAEPGIAEAECTLGVQGHWNVVHRAFDLQLDQSCLDTHPESTDPAPCQEPYHVLANHVSTPFFIRMGMRDTAWLDLNEDIFSGDDILTTADHWHGGTPGQQASGLDRYRWEADEFALRVQTQSLDIAGDFRIDSELATGADTTYAAGFPADWSLGLYVSDTTGHNVLTDTTRFTTPALKACRDNDGDGVYDTLAGARSAEGVLDFWLNGPAGRDVPAVHGFTVGRLKLLTEDDTSEPCL